MLELAPRLSESLELKIGRGKDPNKIALFIYIGLFSNKNITLLCENHLIGFPPPLKTKLLILIFLGFLLCVNWNLW